MDTPTQTQGQKAKAKGKNGGKNGRGAREAYYDTHLQARHGAALGGAERHHPGAAEDGLRAGDLALQGRQGARLRGRRGRSPPRRRSRRVLVLENPKLRGKSRITQSLYAGLQLILPGEIAPPHRHAASAIRFILDGEGAYTQVDGEKTIMAPGDFVLTPYWTIHDHGNTSKKSMIWLDVLDVPTVNFFETSFYEHFDEEKQNTRRDRRATRSMRYGSGVLPDGTDRTLEEQPDHQLPLRQDAADPRAADEGRRHRSAPRRALPLRQSGHRRPGDADHGRASRAAAEGLQGQGLPVDRRHHLRLRRGRGHAPRSAARCWSGARRTCSSSRPG